ncbi:hypothetical protein ACQKWADRAFT_24056 [Trichoderma austrokoningii]
MRSLTSISIGILAGAITSVARPDAKAFAHNEANELVPTPTVALELRNAAAAATTIVEPPPFKVTLCPKPTGIYETGPLDFKTEGIFGCQAGYVCNPPKPDGCNFWPGLPDPGFRCNPEDCIPAPPLLLANWEPGKTGYIPHQDGYFYLDPHIFGLTYDIFEFHVVKKIENGCTSTYTTGNWGSSAQAYGSVPTDLPSSEKRGPGPFEQQARRKANHEAKRQTDPKQTCMGPCQDALGNVQKNGNGTEQCAPDSAFTAAFTSCVDCIANATNISPTDIPAIENILGSEYVSIFFCNPSNPTNPTSTSSAPESIVTGSNTLGSSSQVSTSPTSLIQSTTSSSKAPPPPPPPPTSSSTKPPPPPPTSSSTKPPPPPPTSSSTKPPPPPPTSSSTKPPPPPPTSSSTKPPPPPPTSSSTPPSSASTPPSSSQQASSTPPSSGAGSSASSTPGSPESSSAIGVTGPSSDFSSPGELERASSTNPGSSGGPGGGAGPTGTNGNSGIPGGVGPTGSPSVGGGSSPPRGGVSGTGANPSSPTNSLPPPLTNDLSRPSENFGLLIVALLALLVF